MNTATARGLASKRRGDAWETMLDAYHRQLSAEHRAHIVRVPTEARVMGETRTDARGRTAFLATWASRASVDFVGCLLGGRAVAIEAKTCTQDRWTFAQALGAPTSTRPADVEWRTLQTVNQMGGLSLVVLDWCDEQWCVEFGALATFRETGAGSLSVEQLASIARPIVGPAWWRP